MAENTLPIRLTVTEVPPEEGFLLQADNPDQTVSRGTPGVFAISFTPVGAFAGSVRLDLLNAPFDAIWDFAPEVISAGEVSILSITTDALVAATYDMEVFGSDAV